MAVTWEKLVYADDAILKALLTAAGDIIYASGVSTPAKLAKGANGEVLTLAAGLPSWGAAAAGAALTVAETEVYNGAAPTSWTDLDLSGTIGSNTALVLLKINYADYDIGAIAVRKNGETDEFYTDENWGYGVARGSHAGGVHMVLLVATDTSGVIEWKCMVARDPTTVDIMAYIK